MRRSLVAAAAGLLTLSLTPAAAEEAASTYSQWAEAAFIDADGQQRAAIRIEATHSQGLSAEDLGPTESTSERVCFAGAAGAFAFDSCTETIQMSVSPEGALAEGSVPVVVTFKGVPVWSETVTLRMTFVDQDRFSMPSARLWTQPMLRLGTSWSFKKPADVTGSIISPTLGEFPFTGVPGWIGEGHGVALGTSWSSALGDGTSW